VSTLLVSEVFAPRVGGTATWFLEVYRRYPPGEAVVLTDYQPGDDVVDTRLPLPVHRVPMRMADWGFLGLRSARQYVGLALAARKLIKAHRVASVHCGRVMPEGVVGYLLRRLTGVPYCIYAHGEEIGTAGASRQLTLLMRCAYGAARAVVANSDNTRRLLRAVGVSDSKIVVIRPGVDSHRFRPGGDGARVREKLGLDGHRVLLTVGRLQRRKGHDTVIRALPAVRASVPDVHYLIVGTGEEQVRLRELAVGTGVGDAVRFAGHVPEEGLPAYYQACDVFVLPNREEANRDVEGFGIVFLEASASGKPIVAGRSGGAGEAVVDGETGVLVDGDDVDAVARATTSVLQDPGRSAHMGPRGRARVLESFGWDAIARRTRAELSERRR
jgi:phosphatidylinositol alpha-1,6-mannosyltransferase